MPNPIAQWKSKFLSQRGLTLPTGRPLYTYRTSDEEFAELEATLRDQQTIYFKVASLGDVARQQRFFPPLFVLYAAEWWRRRYDGTGFAWDPIVNSIGGSADKWNPIERSACVERGLQDWALRLSLSHGLRYLGSIAVQGGLPIRLLADPNANIGGILKRSLKLAGTGRTDAAEILDWIKSLAHFLPNAYRQDEVFVLLADVVLTVLRIRQQASLSDPDRIIEDLDRTVPQWRNEFPFPLDDPNASELFRLALGTSQNTQIHRSQVVLVERSLDIVGGGSCQLRSEIVLPEFVDSAALVRLFGIDAENLCRILTLRFSRGEKALDISLRRLAGQDRYRIERRPMDSRGEHAAAEHTMSLLSATGDTQRQVVVRGEALDPELPWIFEPRANSSNAFRLVRQGSGSIADIEGLVSVPQGWYLTPTEAASAIPVGADTQGHRAIWKVQGSVRIDAADGLQYRVRCGQAAVDDRFEVRGTRFWDTFESPAIAFRGVPTLCQVSDNELAKTVQGPIAWRIPGGRSTIRPEEVVGPVNAIWPAQGETKWRSRMVILPEQATMVIEPGLDPTHGALRFSQWDLLAAECDTPGVVSQMRRDGSSLVVELRYESGGNPPEWCTISAVWRANPNPVRLKLPFPARGVRVVNSEGAALRTDSLLAVGRVCGIRFVGFLGTGVHEASLRLGLHRGNHAHPVTEVTHTIKANVGGSRVEVRLVDHAIEIQRMLAGADDLDAYVSVKLSVAGGESATLRVARYEFEFEFERHAMCSEVGLPQDQLSRWVPKDLATLPVLAIRIDAPGDEPIRLAPITSEGVPTGNWLFPSAELSPGPWLIYPGGGAQAFFRPMLLTIFKSSDTPEAGSFETEQVENVSEPTIGLMTALGSPNEGLRIDMVDAVILSMAADFIHDDWRLAEQLAVQLGHLPLSTLDLWRRFSHSASGMAALAIRIGGLPSGFAERFPNELPFLWETVPLLAWIQAMRALVEQGKSWYGEEHGAMLTPAHLDQRIQALASSCPSLRVILEAARAIATGVISQDLVFAQLPTADPVFSGQLFDGEDSRVQHLLRNNAERNWPAGFASELASAKKNGGALYFCQGDYGFHGSVINVPILLALYAATGPAIDWERDLNVMESLRKIQAFDPEWFAEAFDLTVARCISRRAITLN